MKRLTSRRGYVEFQDVTFSYPGAEEPALTNISFSAKPGEVTAIIGGTGSGKSTLVNLIPALLRHGQRPHPGGRRGCARDGAGGICAPRSALCRKRRCCSPERSPRISAMARKMLRTKRSGTRPRWRRPVNSSRKCRMALIRSIAQGGTNVSGGQKQRLSIARALVRKPEIYVFDDSFSALDFKTDAKLRAALKGRDARCDCASSWPSGSAPSWTRTRSSSWTRGAWPASAPIEELMRTCEVYREIVSSQLSMEEIAEGIA